MAPFILNLITRWRRVGGDEVFNRNRRGLKFFYDNDITETLIYWLSYVFISSLFILLFVSSNWASLGQVRNCICKQTVLARSSTCLSAWRHNYDKCGEKNAENRFGVVLYIAPHRYLSRRLNHAFLLQCAVQDGRHSDGQHFLATCRVHNSACI